MTSCSSMLFYHLLNPTTIDWSGWHLLQIFFIFIFNELQSMPEWDLSFTDLISFSVSLMREWGFQRNYWVNIIIYFLKHVSAASLSVLSARGILRSTVQSVARYFVHGCSVPVPRGLRVKPWSPLTICCCHWGWRYHVHSAMPAQWAQDQAVTFSATALRPTVILTRLLISTWCRLVAGQEACSAESWSQGFEWMHNSKMTKFS